MRRAADVSGRRGADEDRGASHSGHERNHLFLSDAGTSFLDAGGISGLDHSGDGRAFATLDFDRDGWTDIALVSANAPLFQLFRNRIGDTPAAASAGIVAIALRGGNRSAAPSREWSARDAYGARVDVEIGEVTLVRELRGGEGFAAQNSAVLLVGVGARRAVDRIRIRWPSGRESETRNVPVGTRLTVYENPAHSPSGEAFVRDVYSEPRSAPEASTPPAVERPRLAGLARAAPGREPLRLYTTMATWCAACRREQAQVARLREHFAPSELGLFAVPVDEKDTRTKLSEYVATHRPAYHLLLDLAPEVRDRVRAEVNETFGEDLLPATFITDEDGGVIAIEPGVPTVSRIRELLARE